jgi:rhodanese-related sulfurtransferase
VRGAARRLAEHLILGPPPKVTPAEEAPVLPPPVIEPADATDDLELERAPEGAFLLDIREPGEYAGGVARGARLLPMDLVPHHLEELPRDRVIAVYCAAGARSFGVAHWLREQGFARAFSVAPGVSAVGPLVVPAGGPGRMVRTPADFEVEGVHVGAVAAEVIGPVAGGVEVRFQDAQGFWVRGRIRGQDLPIVDSAPRPHRRQPRE